MTDSKSISRLIIVIGLMAIGLVMAVSVVTNPSGGLAALVPLIAVLLTVLGIVNPRAGLYGLAALVIWVDEFKRLAVYFGGAYSTTVYQTLAMPFVVLAGLHVGFMLNIVFGRARIDKLGVLIYALGGIVGAVIFFTMDGEIPARAQRAANIAGYVTLIPIAYTYLKTFEEWKKFFSFQCLVALPAAAWAIKQYYWGFDNIEWTYARSGLSQAHYTQMFLFIEPRVFGFFGSASALGCCAIYCAFSWWRSITDRRKRLLWIFISLVFTYVLILSTQRGALLYPLVMIPFVFCFRRRITTFAVYGFGAAVFISGVFSANYLIEEGLDNINRVIASDTPWGQKVLNVGTFSDRLRGWERLSRAKSYSLLGTDEETFSDVTGGYDVNSEDYNHDIINKILISYGILGILAVGIPGAIAVYSLHKTIYHQSTVSLRNNAAFALALSYPLIIISFVGGDNFNANPINIQVWTALAGVFVCRSQTLTDGRTRRQQLLEEERKKQEELEAQLLAG